MEELANSLPKGGLIYSAVQITRRTESPEGKIELLKQGLKVDGGLTINARIHERKRSLPFGPTYEPTIYITC